MHRESRIRIQPRPYLLKNQIQNYAWGSRGKHAFIPKFLGIEADDDKPYAELWMGAHPNAPSQVDVDGSSIALNELISQYPNEVLGQFVATKFSGKLPFLFKVISAAESLSIQAHPNKEQAIALHAQDPQHYPDDNHKPEVAIALTSLKALVGFKSFPGILQVLKSYPEITDYIGKQLINKIENSFKSSTRTTRDLLKSMYSTLMNKSISHPNELAVAIEKLATRLKSVSRPLDAVEKYFFNLQEKYGADVGLLSIFLLNLIQLKAGEGIFLSAGIPHAYLKGDIIECLANSDNVVRAGLTPKYKDVKTLAEILTYEMEPVSIIKGISQQGEVLYKTPAQEFEVSCLKLTKGQQKHVKSLNSPAIVLIVAGNISISWIDEVGTNQQDYHRGQSILIPAILAEYQIIATHDSMIFKVEVPSK